MFLSVSIAGVLFARSSSFGRAQKVFGAVMLVVAVVGAAAIITRGNAGPPGSYRWRNLPQALAEGKATAGGLDIEIIPDDARASGANMRLIIPLTHHAAFRGGVVAAGFESHARVGASVFGDASLRCLDCCVAADWSKCPGLGCKDGSNRAACQGFSAAGGWSAGAGACSRRFPLAEFFDRLLHHTRYLLHHRYRARSG